MSRRGRLLRLAAFAAGVALVAWLVHGAGTARVFAAMESALRWLPVVVLLEGLVVFTDLRASRALVGGAGAAVPPALWLRATALAYASSVLLPAGRAAGEATRAATLAPAVGLGHTSGACTRLQAAVLFANAIVSTLIAVTIALSAKTVGVLPWALLGNALVCSLGGAALLVLLQSERFQAWLRRLFPRLVRSRPAGEVPPGRGSVGLATALALAGQSAQTLQYGVVAMAVGGRLGLRIAMTAQGVHLVGAAVGDAIPGQMGATEGAYRLFAPALGIEVSQALSIALVVRAAQLLVALAGLAVGLLAVAPQVRAAGAR